jgi:hypothetical protein
MIDKRDSFLLEMYQASWDNVSRNEDAIWKVFAAYAALFAGLAIASKEIDLFTFLLFVIVFGLFGAIFSQHANLWFLRNMGMISNLEKEFLVNGDYGVLVPAEYKDKLRYWNLELWSIMTILFLSIDVLSIAFLSPKMTCGQILSCSILFVAGLVIVIAYASLLWVKFHEFKEKAPGKVT